MTSIVLLLLLSASAFSQQNPSLNKKEALNAQPEAVETSRKSNRTAGKKKQTIPSDIQARTHIQNLKNGVLLVRLRTSEKAISSLEKAGNEQMAATLKRRQEAENKRLIAAFQQHFKFCPVYFFFSTNSEKIKAGNYMGGFVNENLQPAADPQITERNYYVAEITDLEQYRPEPDDLNASNNAEVSFKALVVRDNDFHQLTKPFPYFIKASQNIPPRKRSEPEMVELLNENLASFYKSMLKKR
ncbi:hypothetical protein I5M27_01985 [Adhaeribacter sp. BT258]|uniref:GLPGLI family protein n=1 Tax=Adhaeribacter terrigena TaxID=2793070 RepID=A0ABS1BZP2_9BACT|nr:hypothetical protein [Adhaeribacter terrigena]MBK0401735.1 hypothetical protein [Adhaeribacter terrigena]